MTKDQSRAPFYAYVREHLGVLNQVQVNGFENLFAEWFKYAYTDVRWLAYIFATAWHETWRTMHPIAEVGSESYLRSKPYYPYFGRGFVQITWKTNYQRYGIAANPDKALDPAIAAHITLDGMIHGVFTGKALSNYFNANVNDPYNARRIINGLDKAQDIAEYHATFYHALKTLDQPAVPPKA